jgi:antitoxin HicB
MKDLKEYKNLKYRMVIEYHPEDEAYFVKFPELPGCVADGATAEKALKNALIVKNEWLNAAYKAGWTIIEPVAPSETSGRVTLRLPKSIHERLADRAEMEGVSLNQLILTYVTAGLEKAVLNNDILQLQQELVSQFSQIKDIIKTATEFKVDQVFTLEDWGYPLQGQENWGMIRAKKERKDVPFERYQGTCNGGLS